MFISLKFPRIDREEIENKFLGRIIPYTDFGSDLVVLLDMNEIEFTFYSLKYGGKNLKILNKNDGVRRINEKSK